MLELVNQTASWTTWRGHQIQLANSDEVSSVAPNDTDEYVRPRLCGTAHPPRRDALCEETEFAPIRSSSIGWPHHGAKFDTDEVPSY